MSIDSNRIILALPIKNVRVIQGESNGRNWGLMSVYLDCGDGNVQVSLDITKVNNKDGLKSVVEAAKFMVVSDGFMNRRPNKKIEGEFYYQVNAKLASTDFVEHDMLPVNVACITGTVAEYDQNFVMLDMNYYGGFGDKREVRQRRTRVLVGSELQQGQRIGVVGKVAARQNGVEHLHVVSESVYYKK